MGTGRMPLLFYRLLFWKIHRLELLSEMSAFNRNRVSGVWGLKRLSWYVVVPIPYVRAAKYGIKCIKVYRKKIHYSGYIMTKRRGDIHEKYICSSAYCVHAVFL